MNPVEIVAVATPVVLAIAGVTAFVLKRMGRANDAKAVEDGVKDVVAVAADVVKNPTVAGIVAEVPKVVADVAQVAADVKAKP
jgi:hypothetical protein